LDLTPKTSRDRAFFAVWMVLMGGAAEKFSERTLQLLDVQFGSISTIYTFCLVVFFLSLFYMIVMDSVGFAEIIAAPSINLIMTKFVNGL